MRWLKHFKKLFKQKHNNAITYVVVWPEDVEGSLGKMLAFSSLKNIFHRYFRTK